MKVMRERRFLVALAAVSAIGMGSAGTSSAVLAVDGHSYTQPGAELVMPFDARAGKASYLLVTNMNGQSSLGGAQVTTHWTFWSDTCDELANFSICLTLNDTVVVDPTNARSLDALNQEQGPLIDLTGKRGIVTVSAFETDAACSDFRQNGEKLVDNAIVGAFTFADTEIGYAFGNDALVLGLGTANKVVLPDTSKIDSFDIEVFDPSSVDASTVVFSHLAETSNGPVEPTKSPIRFATTFYDTAEIPTSLPDVVVSCATFTEISADTNTLIPPTIDVATAGIIRLHPVPRLASGNYLYSVVGQAVGPYGESSSAKVNPGLPSASRAFVDAPASLLD